MVLFTVSRLSITKSCVFNTVVLANHGILSVFKKELWTSFSKTELAKETPPCTATDHCLPSFPPPAPLHQSWERSEQVLLDCWSSLLLTRVATKLSWCSTCLCHVCPSVPATTHEYPYNQLIIYDQPNHWWVFQYFSFCNTLLSNRALYFEKVVFRQNIWSKLNMNIFIFSIFVSQLYCPHSS